MSTKGIVVQELDEVVAACRSAQVVHLVLRDVNVGSGTWKTVLLRSRRPQGVPFDELAFDWAIGDWEVDSLEGHSSEASDPAAAGRIKAAGYHWEVHQGGAPPRPHDEPSLDNNGK